MDSENYRKASALTPFGAAASGQESDFLKNVGSNTLTFGAQVLGVDEPRLFDCFELAPYRIALPMYFDEIAEPRELLVADLVAIVKSCGGSYRAAAKLIGASEAFVWQNAKGKKYFKNRTPG